MKAMLKVRALSRGHRDRNCGLREHRQFERDDRSSRSHVSSQFTGAEQSNNRQRVRSRNDSGGTGN